MNVTPAHGMATPWGAADFILKEADGIWWVNTPSHGGYYLTDERLAEMPESLKTPTTFYSAGSHWFEEDCEWWRIALAFPWLFDAVQAEAALAYMASAKFSRPVFEAWDAAGRPTAPQPVAA